jgi:hypothetical protein
VERQQHQKEFEKAYNKLASWLQSARFSSLPDLTRSFPVKFGLVVNPVPRNIFPVNRFWYVKLCFHELGPALLVELEFLIAAVIYAENRVAYWSTTSTGPSRIHIERTVEAVCFTASLDRIKGTNIEDIVE